MSFQKLPSRTNTAALFVTYHSAPGFRERFVRIANQVETVIIVDNTPGSSPDPELESIVSDSVDLVKNKVNEGLGYALNQGMHRAIERGCAWVLTLDQDTVVDTDMFERLCEIAHADRSPDTIALIASNARSQKSGRLYLRSGNPERLYREVKTPMTSGSLTSVAAHQAIGGFREDFFIGSIDLEYCLRARTNGFRVLCSERALMTHAAGDTQERKFLGRTVLISEQSLLRWYLDFRNITWVLRRYWSCEPAWTTATFWALVKRIFLLVLFENHRLAKIGALSRGIFDGISTFPNLFDNAICASRAEVRP